MAGLAEPSRAYKAKQLRYKRSVLESLGWDYIRYELSEMVSKIGQCMGIAFAFYDLRHSYDYLKATMDILRGDNLGAWNKDKEFEKLMIALLDRVWVE